MPVYSRHRVRRAFGEVLVTFNRRQFIEVAAGLATIVPGEWSPPIQDQHALADPLDVRRDFPVVRDGIYLNSAYIAPVPLPVAEAARLFAERKASKPIPLGEMQAKSDEVRRQFARLVGAGVDEIGFLFATSEGENIVASALDLQRGDNVVVDELHYETTFVLYRQLEKSRGIALRIVKHRDGRVTRDDFARAVDADTPPVSCVGLASERLQARHAPARGPGARAWRAVLRRRGAGARHVSRRRSSGRR